MNITVAYYKRDPAGAAILNVTMEMDGGHEITVMGVRVADGIVLLPGVMRKSGFFRIVYLGEETMRALVEAVRGCLAIADPELLPLRPWEEQKAANEMPLRVRLRLGKRNGEKNGTMEKEE